jgi:hypothetical protein
VNRGYRFIKITSGWVWVKEYKNLWVPIYTRGLYYNRLFLYLLQYIGS